MAARAFAFRPRYRGLAMAAIGVGGTVDVVALAVLGAALLPLATGAIGIALGVAYLASPTWKLEVVVDDDGLEVRSPKRRRFRVAWNDVVAVVASPSTHTCFVDGGSPDKSLVVPGDGAPAPYDLADKPALFDAILAHVDPAKVTTVETLEKA
ncbi:MAG TPA: PH domain-containing protein [Kofleriaceae bacterium]